ncbi:unnamed protein product [Didymodactylos carnosus]|uniref:Uncharacterized protein n=1 Tax=Didymodactylos carnosus TaxID=1234261 RepID=A0A814YDX3_9BILA|nr:unnamed protein product [Didymodactylos carnosus]CAF3990395.1 unnamed protein product [Didymodactylos carnosus]
MKQICSGSIIRAQFAYEHLLTVTGRHDISFEKFKDYIVTHNTNLIKIYSRRNQGTYIIMSTPEQYGDLVIKKNESFDDILTFVTHDNNTALFK